MLPLVVLIDLEVASGSGINFRKTPCDKERQKLRLNELKIAKPPNQKVACVSSDHTMEEDYDMNYKLESELLNIHDRSSPLPFKYKALCMENRVQTTLT